jgi:hypothetical protein
MHTKTSFIAFVTAVITALAFTNSSVDAQAYKVESTGPIFEDIPSPEFALPFQKKFKPKDWLEIEAPLKVLMAPEPSSKTAERIVVKWYVAVENPEKRGTYLLLTKDITHVNVPLNEEIFTSVYLSPASVKRLTGSDRGGKKAVNLVGFEVLANGEKIGQYTSGGKAGWWNVASSKISRSESVPLLDKSMTPFANLWWDRYAEILDERP